MYIFYYGTQPSVQVVQSEPRSLKKGVLPISRRIQESFSSLLCQALGVDVPNCHRRLMTSVKLLKRPSDLASRTSAASRVDTREESGRPKKKAPAGRAARADVS